MCLDDMELQAARIDNAIADVRHDGASLNNALDVIHQEVVRRGATRGLEESSPLVQADLIKERSRAITEAFNRAMEAEDYAAAGEIIARSSPAGDAPVSGKLSSEMLKSLESGVVIQQSENLAETAFATFGDDLGSAFAFLEGMSERLAQEPGLSVFAGLGRDLEKAAKAVFRTKVAEGEEIKKSKDKEVMQQFLGAVQQGATISDLHKQFPAEMRDLGARGVNELIAFRRSTLTNEEPAPLTLGEIQNYTALSLSPDARQNMSADDWLNWAVRDPKKYEKLLTLARSDEDDNKSELARRFSQALENRLTYMGLDKPQYEEVKAKLAEDALSAFHSQVDRPEGRTEDVVQTVLGDVLTEDNISSSVAAFRGTQIVTPPVQDYISTSMTRFEVTEDVDRATAETMIQEAIATQFKGDPSMKQLREVVEQALSPSYSVDGFAFFNDTDVPLWEIARDMNPDEIDEVRRYLVKRGDTSPSLLKIAHTWVQINEDIKRIR